MQAIEFYTNLLGDLEIEKQKLQRVLRNYRWVRLAIFFGGSVGVYQAFGNQLFFGSVIIISISLFLFVLARYTDSKTALQIVLNKIKLINSEISALHGNFTGFSSGQKYASKNHPFSEDLDLFKPNGIFSFINRTTSNLGEEMLANMLLYGNEDPKEVNKIVEILAQNSKWILDFRAEGILNASDIVKDVALSPVLESKFSIKSWFNVAKVGIPILAFTSLILYNIDVISTAFFSTLILITLIPTSIELKNTNAVANKISTIEDRLMVIRNQFIALNELSKMRNNDTWIASFFEQNPTEIAEEVNLLIKIIGRFHTRNNMLLGMVINIFLAWDMRQRSALANWQLKNKFKWNAWEEGLAKMEAYISAATIRFNYPDTIYAQINESGNKEMEGLIHPLLVHTSSVKNDFRLIDGQQFLILTGPNMAGKSTYLRAVGCAILFANAGFPVFASKYNYPRVQLYTSMRTSDNLTENSSYFFAELSRLRKLMDAVEQNKTTVFVLLDEILKGTNSKDKEEGSYKFMEKMQSLGAEGVIATHDLSLCNLEKQNKSFFTGHFDSTISLDELKFDYQLKKGVCQNMNASFLLKKMNLVN